MHKQTLNQAWRFFLGDPPAAWGRQMDTSTWRVLDLPHDWSIELDRDPANPSGVANGWFAMGRGWYEKDLDVPEDWRGKKVLVEFEGVYMNAEVWLNADFLGRHPYGYTTFAYDLTPYLQAGQKNTLRVKVDNSAQVNSRWYSGSGIYRPVWLYIAEPVHVAHWGINITTPEITAGHATVRVQTRVENDSEAPHEVLLESQLYAPDGSLVASLPTHSAILAGTDQTFDQLLQVPQPKLWSPESPSLYRLETLVKVDGKTLDTDSTTFGIRSLAWSAEQGFVLNGQPIKMKGGCVHHDNGVLGAASFARSEERKVELLKASGFNAIRCAHNPPAPSFLDACDRLGMLVIDEAFDCWREGKNPFDYHVAFDDWWQRDIESMVCRDRNHPSVVIWSIGNEVVERDGRSGGAAIAQALAQHTRKLDPTRPVTSALCMVGGDAKRTWEDTDAIFAALDIGGYNYQFREYRKDHERQPVRIMAGTESFPMEAYDNWMSVLEHPYVIGDFVWTSMDYIGESGIGRVFFEGDTDHPDFLGAFPWHQAYCGDIDLAGFKRPQSYYRDILWGAGEKLYIAVHTPVPAGKTPKITLWGWPDVVPSWTWPGQEGQTLTVDVYSACEQVELFLNGRSLGVRSILRGQALALGDVSPLVANPAGVKTAQEGKLTATFEVPYEPGELKAVGYEDKKAVAEWTLVTTGAPARIRLTPDCAEIPAAPDSLCYVTVEVTDAHGCLQPNADHLISFSVQGAGELFAVGSGNPVSPERYKASQRRAFQGRCVAVVKSNGQPGEIRLRAQAEGLEATQAVIKAA